MDDNGANVIRVGFELGNLLGSIIVVNSKLEVIATDYYPVLSRDETAGSDGDISRFECFDDSLWKLLENMIGVRCFARISSYLRLK